MCVRACVSLSLSLCLLVSTCLPVCLPLPVYITQYPASQTPPASPNLFPLSFPLPFSPLPSLLCTLNALQIIDQIVEADVHRLVVVDEEKRLKGVVSLSDILKFLTRPIA